MTKGKHKTHKTIFQSLVYFFLLSGIISSLSAQNYKFKHLSEGDGICDPFVYNITQDKNGFIMAGTGEGLCKFDGFSFTTDETLDTLMDKVVSISYTDNLGNIWYGFNDATLMQYDGKNYFFYELGSEIKSSITGIIRFSDYGILVATQNNGLFLINSEGKVVSTGDFSNQYIASLYTQDNYLALGTQEGFVVYKYIPAEKKYEKVNEVEELAYVNVQVIYELSNKKLLVGTEDQGLYLMSDFTKNDYTIKMVGEGTELTMQNIQSVFLDSKNDLWISTYYKGIFRLHDFKDGNYKALSVFNKDNGLTSNFIKQVFEDREGNIWIATYGKGLSTLLSSSFTFYDFSAYALGNNILSVAVDDSIVWLGGENELAYYIIGKEKELKVIGSKDGLPADNITTLLRDKDKIWIGTSSKGIYQYNKKTKRISSFFKSDNSLGNSVNSIAQDSDYLYAATKNGIYAIDKKTNEKLHYSTITGLPHNDIEFVYIDNNNMLLFATRSNGIYEINELGEVEEYFSVGDFELEFNSITQDNNGKFWVSTFGQGVFCITQDTIINFTSLNGLKSNYCYNIVSSDNQYVWVGHRMGFTRINTENYALRIYDIEQGFNGDCNLNAFTKISNKFIYFGTTEGLVRYNIQTDSKKAVPPITNITKVLISDKPVDFNQPIVLPYKLYKLRVECIGLNYSDPKSVKYQYKLEGYDLEWSDVTNQPYVVYPRLGDGEYIFKVKAYNADGVAQEPVEFKIKIKKPFWKTIWFISLSVVIIVLVVIFIIKFREKKQKQIQDYLEKRLDERTREVVIQKEEIEIKNRDITDSINYAQRIQASILPPVQKLRQNFAGSFVFYQPRDIVSGDFYWFDKISDNKFIIVCADSTGHGVPGAFMSMIGTTLIKDICMRSEVNSPSKILEKLDEELRGTLNQNIEASTEQSNDGMDIIVAEIDTKSFYLRYASAMRPMIVYRNGEQIYVKGSRSSVGGHYDKDEKDFKDEGIQLGKGDLIYMFSDGYPDQFGGPIGKKFKMVRLKNLLRDIHKKTMEEQYEYVKSTFNLWKEELDQVDDVLFMGIKL